MNQDAEQPTGESSPKPASKRKYIAAGLAGLVVVLLAVGVVVLRGKRFTIDLTQSEIQASLDAVFPIEKRHLLILVLVLHDPQVILRDGEDRVSFGITATVNIQFGDEPKPLGGDGTITTGLRYEPDSYSFYLDDSVLEKLEVQGIPVKYVDVVNKLARELAEERLRRIRVYTLKKDNLKQSAARLMLQGLTVRDGKLIVTLGL